jgi:hypothetical protein
MPIVTCPKCRKRYDPGMDDELDALPRGLSLKVVCPACGQWLRLPEREAIPAPPLPPEVLQGMKSQSRLVDEEAESPGPQGGEEEPPRPKPWWKFW